MEFLKISISTLVALGTGTLSACGAQDSDVKNAPDSKIKDYLAKVNTDKKPDVKEELKRMCANPQ